MVTGSRRYAWEALDYVAAARRVAGIQPGIPFADAETSTEAWTLMAEPFWDRFEVLLAKVPSGSDRVESAERNRWIEEVADLLVM